MSKLAAKLRHAVNREDGASTAEFVMTSTLLTLIVVSVLQLGIILYARTIMMDAASAGARHAVLIDRSLADGISRSESLLASSLPADLGTSVVGTQSADRVSVTVAGKVPMLGLLPSPVEVSFTGHAYTYFD
ncbi:TadE family protein [Micrococcoides hystricis]|uniref:TadE family protein n=1 Tax=Micrococcoides hystricis TaxID=1572761 RepID=A0ABV6P8I4_9MICC